MIIFEGEMPMMYCTHFTPRCTAETGPPPAGPGLAGVAGGVGPGRGLGRRGRVRHLALQPAAGRGGGHTLHRQAPAPRRQGHVQRVRQGRYIYIYISTISTQVAWALAISWLILACVKRRGGIINTVLCHPVWIPLSRVQYCLYLLHRWLLELQTNHKRTEKAPIRVPYDLCIVSVIVRSSRTFV